MVMMKVYRSRWSNSNKKLIKMILGMESGSYKCELEVIYWNFFNLNELLTTDTELRDMAAAANTGFSKIPKNG